MKLSIRTKLLGAFAIDLLLMVALGSFALYQMSVMNERASFVERYTIRSLDISDKFNFVIARYRSAQLEYIINNSNADKDRIAKEMKLIETEMQGYIESYRELITSDDERRTFDRFEAYWIGFVAANNKFLVASRLNNTGTVQPAFNRLNPLHQKLVDNAQQLVQLSRSQATEDLEAVQAAYATSRYVIAFDTFVTIVLSALIGLALAGTIARRVGRLTAATKLVASGDLERRVEMPSDDELGTLAHTFNQMVESLREQRTMLEERNTALQESLHRQQQLTEDLLRGKQAEQAAYEARAAAEAATKAKSMFLATMSHELRTPLNAVLGYAQLLRLRAAMAGYHELLDEMDRIQAAGKHLLSIISNILDFSKIEQGKMTIDVAQFDVEQMTHETVILIEPLAVERSNRLEAKINAAIGVIESDEAKVRQILFNLLSNAIKFTQNGIISLTVDKEFRDQEAWVRFTISDTGIGISPEQVERLFQPFTQADASTTRKYGGTGLGLALSQELCQLLGGTITVTSNVGQGSVFSVLLPAKWHQPTTARNEAELASFASNNSVAA